MKASLVSAIDLNALALKQSLFTAISIEYSSALDISNGMYKKAILN
jgi:hypothetical protein